MFPRQLWADPESHSAAPGRACHCFLAESTRRWDASLLQADCPHREWFVHLAQCLCSGACQHPCWGETPYLVDWHLAELRLVDLGFFRTVDYRPYSDGSFRCCLVATYLTMTDSLMASDSSRSPTIVTYLLHHDSLLHHRHSLLHHRDSHLHLLRLSVPEPKRQHKERY